jgi:ABC-2 type transport system permease protein
MQRLLTIIHKEFIHIVRDRRTLIMITFMPGFLLLLLGYAVSNEVDHMPLAIADFSNTDASREFVSKFTTSTYFDATHYVTSEKALINLMDQNLVFAGLTIPEEFGRQLSTGESAQVMFYINGADLMVAQSAQLAAETISQNAAQQIFFKRINSSGISASSQLPISTHFKYLYNPDMRRLNYMIPGLVAMILQQQALLLTALSIVREREQGTIEQLIVTPVKAWELMLGKILPYVLIALGNVLLTLSLGVFWFKVPIAGNIGLLMLLSLIFILGSLGLGILISNIAKTQMQAMYISSFGIQIPSMILSGFVFPRINMSPVVYWAGNFLPITYFLEIVRGIVLKGVEISVLWRYILPLSALSLFFFTASVISFRKRIS